MVCGTGLKYQWDNQGDRKESICYMPPCHQTSQVNLLVSFFFPLDIFGLGRRAPTHGFGVGVACLCGCDNCGDFACLRNPSMLQNLVKDCP